MANLSFKYFKSNIIIGLIVILGLIFYIFHNYISQSFGITFSVISVVSLILILIDKYLWKYAPFKWLLWVPNISGRYKGDIKYSYFDNKNVEITGILKCILVIKQTASNIVINSFFTDSNGNKSSPSQSTLTNIVKEEDDSYSITFTYLNKGMKHEPHFGTNVLKFINKGTTKKLIGNYYTDRKPRQTRGTMELKYISNKLHHEF